MLINTEKNSSPLLKRLYHALFRIRWVELEIARVYPTDVIKSPIHLSIGQEYLSVGVCDVLQNNDVVFGTYRGHALYLAKGGRLDKMMAELYGKVDGCCRGKGGSMHLADSSVNMMGTSAIVASSIPEAVGYAMALRYRESDQVVVCFFGDGATGEGVFHESLNFASLKKLPILFVCENNDYAIHSRLSDRSVQVDLCKFAQAHHISSHLFKGEDIFELRDLSNQLINEIRAGGGPRFIEAYAYRWMEHVGPNDDWDMKYRSKEEISFWEENDQIRCLGDKLSFNERQCIEKLVKDEVAEAMRFAEHSAYPNEEEIFSHVYK